MNIMDLEQITKDLTSEIQLSSIQAKVFLLIVTEGKMTIDKISEKLMISHEEAHATCKQIVDLGGFIEMSETEFESMHPRFSAVNMFRRFCERTNKKFSRNITVDNIGVALEKPYEDARTKK
jgi:predicted transcriptional regulator